jgi:ubiquinone/menaquinone biosynthesis C-methylase UbiE
MININKYNFDNIAADYNKHHSEHKHFIDFIKKNVLDAKPHHILDLGCGTGNETVNLKKFFNCKVTGIEPSPKMLSIAKQSNVSINWLIGSAENIPVPDKSVDILTAFFSIHHFEDFDKAFKEINRVLSVNGKVFIFTISHQQLKNSLEYQFIPELLKIDVPRVPKIEFIKKQFSKQGFITNTNTLKYETRRINKEYLIMVKNRYRTGLRMLSSKQIETAIERIKKELEKEKMLIDNIFCTVITAERKKLGR